VRVLELARAMIELSGLDPDRDIEIEIVGRRPGEKLHEDLFNSYERPRETSAEKILLAEREPLGAEAVESIFAEIGLLVLEGDAAGLAAKVSELSALHVEAQAGASARRPPVDQEAREDLHEAPAALIHSPDS
jgi:FlaA1/EpsC-like NDP-sugar epimerase